jgi:hypothetical protein
MFCLFRLFHIDLGLGEIKITFEALISAFVGSLLCIFAWRLIPRGAGPKSNRRVAAKQKLHTPPTTFFMKLLTILAISIGLLTASQAMQKPWFHTKGTRWLDCPVMNCIILCKCGSEHYEVSDQHPHGSHRR